MALYFAPQREATFRRDGCLSLRKSVLDRALENSAPGPIYDPRPRVTSTERSGVRDINFGTAPARCDDKESGYDDGSVIGSPESRRRQLRRRVQSAPHPGPQTYDPTAIRKAIYLQSNNRSVTGFKFGTGQRECNASERGKGDNNSGIKFSSDNTAIDGNGTDNAGNSISNNAGNSNVGPSPAEYDPEKIRRGIMFSKKICTTSVRFGTSRNDDPKPSELPGPATYDPEAIRRGIMFTKGQMTSVKFGDPPPQRFSGATIGSDLRGSSGDGTEGGDDGAKAEGANGGKVSGGDSLLLPTSVNQPGPQEYDTDNVRRGLLSLSTKKRPPGVRFTTGPRTYNDAEERERASKPGPSTYDVPSTLGKQSNSRYRSQPSISFGTR